MSALEGIAPGNLLGGRLLLFVLVACIPSGCAWINGAVIVIKNAGPRTVEQLRLEVGGGMHHISAIQSGETKLVKPEVTGDSSLRIVYVEDNLSVTCDGDVYFTSNMRVRVEAEIGGGACRVVDVTD